MHVLLSTDTTWSAALTIPHDKVRVSFAVPWEGMLLLGTTDNLHDGGPDSVVAEQADIAHVLAEAAVALDGARDPPGDGSAPSSRGCACCRNRAAARRRVRDARPCTSATEAGC